MLFFGGSTSETQLIPFFESIYKCKLLVCIAWYKFFFRHGTVLFCNAQKMYILLLYPLCIKEFEFKEQVSDKVFCFC